MKTKHAVVQKIDDLGKDSVKALGQINPQVVFAFGSPTFFKDSAATAKIKAAFPTANIVGCSTAGEICNDDVLTNSLVLTAAAFDKATMKFATTDCKGIQDSEATGERIAKQLAAPDLKGIFILLQGLDLNGSAVIKGMQKVVGTKVIITGGLAGDNGEFKQTYIVHNERAFSNGAVAIGFYGDSVKITYGSVHGWQPFGPSRKVTKAEGNVLYELDNSPALTVYKSYLGDMAKQLPASALHFPLSLVGSGKDGNDLIRTVLAIDEAKGSLILAGDIQSQSQVRLMHAQKLELVHGAEEAGNKTKGSMSAADAEGGLAIMVSCVGRKLVMGQDDVADEVEAARSALAGVPATGFYSYGEICPLTGLVDDCRLHNQTMTITHFKG